MNYQVIAKTLSTLWVLSGLFCLPSFGIAIWEGSRNSAVAYGSTVAIALLMAAILRLTVKTTNSSFRRQEAVVTVVLVWMSLGFLGGLPLYLEGAVSSKSSAFLKRFQALQQPEQPSSQTLTAFPVQPKSGA